MATVKMADPKQFDHDCPGVCMRCGETATVFKKRTFSWEPDWIIILSFVGHLPSIIASTLLTKRMRVETPLCYRHRNHWLGRATIVWFSLLGLFLYIVLAAIFASVAPKYIAETMQGFLIVLGVLGFLGWLVTVVVLQTGTIQPTKITDDTITLTKVSPVFANAYRAIWSDQGFDRRSFSRHKVDLDKVVEKEWNRHSRKIDPQGRRVKSESRAEEIEEGIILPDDQVGENRS